MLSQLQPFGPHKKVIPTTCILSLSSDVIHTRSGTGHKIWRMPLPAMEDKSWLPHTYFLKMSKVPPLKTSSIHIVYQRWKRHKLYLIKITTKNRKKNWHRPLAIIKIFGSISGPSSFFTWTLSGMADIICWRVSSDCLVLLLSLVFVFGIVLRFSSLTYVWRLQSFLLILSVTNSCLQLALPSLIHTRFWSVFNNQPLKKNNDDIFQMSLVSFALLWKEIMICF